MDQANSQKLVASSQRLKDVVVHILFIVAGLFAFIFFEERLFSDSAFYIFHVINEEAFRIEHSRFILIFSQLPAFIAVKSGLGMKAILIIYSIGHVGFFYGIFLICRYLYKDIMSGPLLLLLQTLGIMSGFFTPMFELYYAAGLLVLFSSILFNDPRKPINVALLLLLSFFILTAHQFAFPLLIFIFVLHGLENGKTFLRQYALFAILFAAIYFYKKYFPTDYEKAKTAEFMEAIHAWDFDWQYLLGLIRFLFNYYWEMIVVLTASVSVFLYQRKFLLCILYIFAFAGMLLIANLAQHGFLQGRYQEQVYFPLTFIAAFPFCRYALTYNRSWLQGTLYLITLLLIMHRLHLIRENGVEFSYRTGQMKRLISHARSIEGNKFVISEANIHHPYTLDPYWSYPVETMLLSSMQDEQSSLTICTGQDLYFGNNTTLLTPDKYLFRRWEIYDISSLNEKYFRLERGPYIHLNNVDTTHAKSLIEIHAIKPDKKLKANSLFKCKVRIINKNSKPFYSHPENENYLSYRWLQNGIALSTEKLKTLAEVDIQKEYSQEVIVHSPAEKGDYMLIIDLICPGETFSSAPLQIEVW